MTVLAFLVVWSLGAVSGVAMLWVLRSHLRCHRPTRASDAGLASRRVGC